MHLRNPIEHDAANLAPHPPYEPSWSESTPRSLSCRAPRLARRPTSPKPPGVGARRLLTRWFGFRGQLDPVGRGVGGQFGQACEPGSGGLNDVTTLVEQWLDLALGLGDGACDDAEEFSEDVLGGAEALAQHGDQGLLGEGECGRVPAGWFAAGRPAAADVEFSVALGLVGDCERADHLVPVAGVQAGQGGVCPAGAFGFAGGRPGWGRWCWRLGAVKSARGAVPVSSTGPFPRTASRTRRACFQAPGAPQVLFRLSLAWWPATAS